MIFRDVDFSEFMDVIKYKKVICVGIGRLFEDMILLWGDLISKRIVNLADNNRQGDRITIDNREMHICPVESILGCDKQNSCILITSLHVKSIYDQLEKMLCNTNIECFIYPVMSLHIDSYDWVPGNKEQTIPKVIHYFWFGKGEIPEENKKCIDSWNRNCPDYTIMKWTEDNYDITQCEYMKQAYENKRWGFVPDYARLDILYQYGGIYLDTDVELIKSLDDLLYEDAFVGFQRDYWIALGLGFGCKKGMDIFREMRDIYHDVSFVSKGKLNLTASPTYQTMCLKSHGLINNNQYQKVAGITVFPTDVFDPQGYSYGILKKTENTHSIHHYAESWTDEEVRKNNLNKYSEINSFFVKSCEAE